MEGFVVPLRKQIRDSLNRQGMQKMRGLNRKGLAEREGKEHFFLFESAHTVWQTSLDSEKEHAPRFGKAAQSIRWLRNNQDAKGASIAC